MKVRRLPVRDSVTRDGETVVMVNTRVVLLSELASAALGFIEGVVDVEVVSAALVAEFGTPPGLDPLEATLLILGDLSAEGLVALDD